jgi:hypothetical protein
MRKIFIPLGLLFSSLFIAWPTAFACDTDADCGSGATCIKREKRARGVCYGRRIEVQPPAADRGSTGGDVRQRETALLGDPVELIKENLPGKEVGAVCIVTQDCPPGTECVIAGFEGRCVKL